ncbi:uncharacterized protein [Panulirus ornatus]|uniref:uncharacterized protein isoform X1 n=1 Tax=Panulirus ornatus TaxID=150431 RepID=UPI003A871AED
MILSLPPDIALENYVQVASMAGHSWADGEWDPGECECGGSPPPTFMLPPPPPPPTPPDASPRHHCQGPAITCPSLLGAREDQRSPSVRAPLAVVIVSAATLFVLVIVAAIIVCSRVRGRGRSPKGCTELSGAIIYDDLPSAPTIVPARTRPRCKPVPVDGGEMMGMTMGGHLYTAQPCSNPPSEHLYQSISSGSETCSYSTSEAAGQEGRALLRPSYPRGVRTATPADTDSEEESLAPMGVLGHASDNDTPSVSPAHSRYYCASAPPCTSSPGSGSDYESVYYVGGTRRGRPLTPQQRGLPLLPSRTDRFRIYFSEGRGQRRTPRRRGADRRQPHQHRIQKNPREEEPLYENLT